MQGQICFHQKDFRQAIELWQSLTQKNATLTCLVMQEMIFSYKEQKDLEGLRKYLLSLTSVPKNQEVFSIWQEALFESIGHHEGMKHLLSYVKRDGLSRPVSDYLLLVVKQDCSLEEQSALLMDVLNHAKVNNIEYICAHCGFNARAMHWNCPNCGEWDSFYG